MKAAVCTEFGKPLEIQEVTLAPPKPNELRVKLSACAICHSDIAYAEGIWGGALPAVYGHEASGKIIEMGAEVKGFALGDPVVVTLIRACGDCEYCAHGHPTSCQAPYDTHKDSPLQSADGEKLTQGMAVAAFAEEVNVDASQIVPMPKDMPMDIASLLACGVITGYGAVTNSAKMPKGSNVVVIGAGGVGLNTIQAAAIEGAKKVVAVDMTEDKLATAAEFGATHTVLAGGQMKSEIETILEGKGADFVFVTVGAIRAFSDAPDLLGPRGEVIMVGMPPVGAKAEYEPVNLAAASQAIRGSKMGEAVIADDIPKLIASYQTGTLKLDQLISNHYRLEDINEAIENTKSGQSNRNVIMFDE